jgi:hypothetical protein
MGPMQGQSQTSPSVGVSQEGQSSTSPQPVAGPGGGSTGWFLAPPTGGPGISSDSNTTQTLGGPQCHVYPGLCASPGSILFEHFHDDMRLLRLAPFLRPFDVAMIHHDAIAVQDVLLHPDALLARQFLACSGPNLDRGDVPVRVLPCADDIRRRVDDVTFRLASAWLAYYKRRTAIRMSRGGFEESLQVCVQGTRLIKAELHVLQHFTSERASLASLQERPIAWMPIPAEEYAGLYMRNLGARLILLPAEGWLRSAITLSQAYVRHLIASMPAGTYVARAKAEITVLKLRAANRLPSMNRTPSSDTCRPPSTSTVAAPCSVPAPSVSQMTGRATRGLRSRGGGRFSRRGRGFSWAFGRAR